MNRWSAGLVALVALAAPLPVSARPPASDTPAVVRGNTQFAFELYGRLRAREGNLFLSPFSISSALSMTSAGAGGRTLEQMQGVLHLAEQERLHPANGLLLRQVNDPGRKGYTLSVANALWGQKGYPFLREFVELNKQQYGAGPREVDFLGDPEGARHAINGWVEKQTHDKVKDLIQKGAVDSNTRLVLANAIYFKGIWASQFKKDRTREGTFFAPGKVVDGVPFMRQKGRFKMHEERGVQVLEMPFAGNDLSMVLLIPTRKDGLADIEKDLSPDKLAGWLKKMRTQRVDVVLPRFQVTAEFDLKATLADLGMPLAFDRERADFSGINGGKEPLCLSAVMHKAAIEVNERGAEASAATGVAVIPRTETPQVRADRAFVFLIRDKKTNSLLFLGRVVNPRK